MEIVSSILSSVLVEAGTLLCGSIYSSLSKTIRLKSNIHSLEKKLKNLIFLRNEIRYWLGLAEKHGKLPAPEEAEWLRKVEDIIQAMDSIQEKMIANREKLGGGALCFGCKLGGKVAKMLKEVEELTKNGNSIAGRLKNDDHETKAVEHIPGPLIQDQPTASKTLSTVMNLLQNDQIRRIGVWGVGGVGKTTLVMTLNNRLKRDSTMQPFGIVIWVTVSKEMDLRRVQVQIAERLNLEVKQEETVERLSIQLHERLLKEKNFLLILDDVWKTMDLARLGVPGEDDSVRSKIILTSRSLDVCNMMKTDVEVRMDFLSEKEAWNLFHLNAGEVARFEHIEPLAKALSRECKGLPLAIVTMGTAMRGKTMVNLWEHALKELQKSVPCIKGIETMVYNPLKWSYDAIESMDTKFCFLYCALFPEDFSIEVTELIQCWLAEGLLDEQENYEDSFNRGIALTEHLKDQCLLENGNREGTVKMHDVVRDVAIWIASSIEDGCKSLVRSGVGLNEVSQKELSSSLKRVSFMNNKISRLPENEVQCPETSTLLLQGNSFLDRVPERFLQGLQSLRVLNMSGTRIKSLPISVVQLYELRSLLLRDCFYLEDLPPIGDLSKLLVLDLRATRIQELPKGIENLSNLRQVNLSRTHYLKTIQAGIFSTLSSLEVLDMTLSNYHWGQATFEELGSLKRLLILSIRLEAIPSLPSSQDLNWVGRLRRFQFFIGPTANSLPTKHDMRRVTISSLDLSGEWIGWLLNNATSLALNHCWGLNHMLETLVIDSVNPFSGLKSLTITNSSSNLRPAGGCVAHDDLLPNLEELHLHDLSYLESISELVGHLGLRFLRLKLIEVTRCHQLKYLLTQGRFILDIPVLEEIKVSCCDKLVELFNYLSVQNFILQPVVPNLRIVELKNLPKLRTPCRRSESWQRLEKVMVIKCNLLRKLPLTIHNANTITEIRGELQWWKHLDWDDNETQSSLQPYFKQV